MPGSFDVDAELGRAVDLGRRVQARACACRRCGSPSGPSACDLRGTGSFDGGRGKLAIAGFLASGPMTEAVLGAAMSPASTLHCRAAACTSIVRACAPAMRSLSQPSRTEVEPPVIWPPSSALMYSSPGGAISTLTFERSTSSSSATSIGTAHPPPSPRRAAAAGETRRSPTS